MNFNLFLLALRARFTLFAVVLGCTVVAASAASLMLPKSYQATSSLLVDAKDEQSLGASMRPLVQPHEMVSYLQTQMDIITSAKVARNVIEDLKLADNVAVRSLLENRSADDAEATQNELIAFLRRGLKVQTSQSSVIQVSFTAREPRLSADIANAFAKSYISTMLELRVEPTREAATWFNEQLKTLRINLEDAQARLTDYNRRRGIVSADEHFDVENTRLGTLADQVTRAQEQTSQWNNRDQQARDSLQRSGATERLPDILDNPFLQKLKEEMLRGEAKLKELSTQYGSAHPQYQRQESENESLRDKLEAETRKAVAAIGSSARQSRQREEDLRRAMAVQRNRILDLKEDRNGLTVLRRNVESAERAYDTAMQRFVVSQVDSRANQTNITVLNPAVAPRDPSKPRVFLNIALSVVVGVMLGIGMVMLAERFDRRVRSRTDLNLADVPVLAVLNPWQPTRHRLLERSGGARRALPNPG
ncbi:MAG: chain length determinant protein EpsF [Prolixibacteraceae bacterium]|nr:chain length determinant protein EpsF [Burkholderiales bacterium]